MTTEQVEALREQLRQIILSERGTLAHYRALPPDEHDGYDVEAEALVLQRLCWLERCMTAYLETQHHRLKVLLVDRARELLGELLG